MRTSENQQIRNDFLNSGSPFWGLRTWCCLCVRFHATFRFCNCKRPGLQHREWSHSIRLLLEIRVSPVESREPKSRHNLSDKNQAATANAICLTLLLLPIFNFFLATLFNRIPIVRFAIVSQPPPHSTAVIPVRSSAPSRPSLLFSATSDNADESSAFTQTACRALSRLWSVNVSLSVALHFLFIWGP